MHIHGTAMQSNPAYLYSAAAADKAVAARRAADVRKKLRMGDGDGEGILDTETDFLVGRWVDGDLRQLQGKSSGQRNSLSGEE